MAVNPGARTLLSTTLSRWSMARLRGRAQTKRPCVIPGSAALPHGTRQSGSAGGSHWCDEKMRLLPGPILPVLLRSVRLRTTPHPNPPPQGGRAFGGLGTWGHASRFRNKNTCPHYGRFARLTPTLRQPSLALPESFVIYARINSRSLVTVRQFLPVLVVLSLESKYAFVNLESATPFGRRR
jgi:hypothetical protein